MPSNDNEHNNNSDNNKRCHEETPLLSTVGEEKVEEESRNSSSPNNNHNATIAALSFAMLVHSYLLVGVFPYSGFLAMHLVPSLNEETVGMYAGLIASSFMMGRTVTSFIWGKAADRYGRLFTIQASMLLSAIFSVLFGLAPTLPLALAARFALGLSNGIIGSVKTIITELSHGDRSRETNTMAIVMGMWGYGFLINPALGGYLADPVKQYPDSPLVELLDSIFSLRAKNPFLLPNVLGSIFCIVAYFLVRAFVEETLPEQKLEPFQWNRSLLLFPSFCKKILPCGAAMMRTVSSWGLFKHLQFTKEELSADPEDNTNNNGSFPRWVSPSRSTTALTILSPQFLEEVKSGTDSQKISSSIPAKEQQQSATIRSLWQRPSTRKHLIVYWAYSFVVIAVDETFPLYCISKVSGLGVEEKIIGNLLSATGAFYIFIQFFLVTGLVKRYGFYRAMKIGALGSVPLVCLIPLSLFTNNRGAATPDGTITWRTLTLLSFLYAIIRAFSSVTFSTITMTNNRTVPAHQRASLNGLSMLGGSFVKAAGPTFGGLLFSTSVVLLSPPWGSVMVWVTLAGLGMVVFVQTLRLPEHDESTTLEESNN